MSDYTVKSVMPTGKEDPKFGKEFYVQFEEDEKPYPLWFKEAPDVGKVIDGNVEGGKFKKVRKEWNPQQNQATEQKPASKPVWKDNSDGMRQGMCFNNAANYVNTIEFHAANGDLKPLTDAEWADTVFSYAQALYRKGDLNVAPEGSQEVSDENPFKDK